MIHLRQYTFALTNLDTYLQFMSLNAFTVAINGILVRNVSIQQFILFCITAKIEPTITELIKRKKCSVNEIFEQRATTLLVLNYVYWSGDQVYLNIRIIVAENYSGISHSYDVFRAIMFSPFIIIALSVKC